MGKEKDETNDSDTQWLYQEEAKTENSTSYNHTISTAWLKLAMPI